MKLQRGFTLVELMIVVVIIAILASIAIPSYTGYVLRSRIAEAPAELASMRVRMEQYFQDNRTYVGACTVGTVAPLPLGRFFAYTCPPASLTANAYLIVATGIAAQGTGGFEFTVNQANARVTTLVPPNTGWVANAGCWVTNQGGVC